MQTHTSIEILADLPGVSKSDLELDIDTDTLIIGVKSSPTPGSAAAAEQVESEPKENAVKSAEGGKHDRQPADAQKPPEASAKPEEKAQPKVHRNERSQNFSKRALKLPETADLTQTSATVTDGVLRIVVAKKELPSPKRIRIA